jgi:hypothetical protein
MKTVYIGDIHGLTTWKKIVRDNPDTDNYVFVGDYFDSFDVSGIEQLFNVENIVRFKKETEANSDKKVYLLIGNHDHHYWPGIEWRGTTSGYQHKMAPAFHHFFIENESMFQMCVLINNLYLCSHAGISEDFLKDTGYWSSGYDNVVDYINDLFKFKPNEFHFDSFEVRNQGLTRPNPYGDNEGQSPIWIRPKSLQRSNKNSELKKDYIQIVGHTQQTEIDIKGKSTGGRYFYIDTLPVNEYLITIDKEIKKERV